MKINPKINSSQFRRFYQQLEPLVRKAYPSSYVPVIFSFLVVALFGWYAIKPTMQTILYLRREIADKTEVSQKMEAKISALIEAQNNLEAWAMQLPLVQQALPLKPEILELTMQMRNLAAVTGASISAVQASNISLSGEEKPAVAKDSKTKKEEGLSLTAVVSGPYATLHSFITGLFEMRRVVTLSSFSFTPTAGSSAGGSDGSSALLLVLKLNTYYLGN